MRFKWTRGQRLSRGLEIRRTMDLGAKVVTPYATFFVSRNGLARSRAALIASRRIGNAVARNRARRRLREALRRVWPDVAGGHDIVVVARSGALDAQWDELQRAVALALERLSVCAHNGPLV